VLLGVGADKEWDEMRTAGREATAFLPPYLGTTLAVATQIAVYSACAAHFLKLLCGRGG